MRMLLEIEGLQAEQITDFAKAESALRVLDADGPHSFMSLTHQDGSYIQVAGGKQVCLVERRDIGDNTHWRAFHGPQPLSLEAPQVLKFGGGQITLTADEVFTVEDVIEICRAFFHDVAFPAATMWRDMTAVLRN